VQPGQLAVQADQRLQRVHRQPLAGTHDGQAERRVRRVALGVLQLDLQAGAAARRFGAKQITQGYAERARDRLEQAQARLPAAVLDERELRRRPPDRGTELFQGEPLGASYVAEPLAQRDEVERECCLGTGNGFDHSRRSALLLLTMPLNDR
jgi:hypothetical protein